MLGLGYPPFYDEGFHILAARSWLQDGSFCIADCTQPYGRGGLFTWLVAGSFAVFGDSLVAARLPSVVAGTLLVAAVFVWVRRESSEAAAVAAAGLCAIAPELIGWSQTSRFYALQALLIWGGATLFYQGVMGRAWRGRLGAVLAAAVCFFVALGLQVTTLIPVAGLGLWFLGWLWVHRSGVSGRTQLLFGAAGVALVAVLAVWQWDTLGALWRQYRGEANLYAMADAANPFFYHSWFVEMYSYLYALLPVAVLVAVAVSPGPALLMTVLFASSFVAHSFGGFKGDRLILYTFPFFFTLWGIALAELTPRLVDYSGRVIRAVTPSSRSSLLDAASAGALMLALTFAALNTNALQTTVRLVTVPSDEWSGEPWYRGHADWTAVRPAIESLLEEVDVVASSSQIKTIYALGRTDVSMSRSQLHDAADAEGTPPADFWVYPITGRPVVGTSASIERLVSCYASGLFLIESGQWRNQAAVTPEMADTIEELAEEVDVPRGTRTRVFSWSRDQETPPATCGGRLDEWATSG